VTTVGDLLMKWLGGKLVDTRPVPDSGERMWLRWWIDPDDIVYAVGPLGERGLVAVLSADGPRWIVRLGPGRAMGTVHASRHAAGLASVRAMAPSRAALLHYLESY
jgi:hypothetical protein